jgi:hypothetical protein
VRCHFDVLPKNAMGFESSWPNSKRYLPPTRTFVSQESRDTPVDFGAHHRLISSGLVHASNTMRAGPLKVRVTTSSRSDFRSTVVRRHARGGRARAAMPAAFTLLAASLAIVGVTLVRGQTINPSAQMILKTDRPLLPAEIARVLDAAREALKGRTFRLSYQPGGMGPEILIGATGRPRYMRSVSGVGEVSAVAGAVVGAADDTSFSERSDAARHVDIITFTDFTGTRARKCDGSALDSELGIEYEHRSDTDRWTVKARRETMHEFAGALFDVLSGSSPIESGDRRQIGDRETRALRSAFRPPSDSNSDPVMSRATQALCPSTFDVAKLPVARWSPWRRHVKCLGFDRVRSPGARCTPVARDENAGLSSHLTTLRAMRTARLQEGLPPGGLTSATTRRQRYGAQGLVLTSHRYPPEAVISTTIGCLSLITPLPNQNTPIGDP